jgi:hypothetical protein
MKYNPPDYYKRFFTFLLSAVDKKVRKSGLEIQVGGNSRF